MKYSVIVNMNFEYIVEANTPEEAQDIVNDTEPSEGKYQPDTWEIVKTEATSNPVTLV